MRLGTPTKRLAQLARLRHDPKPPGPAFPDPDGEPLPDPDED